MSIDKIENSSVESKRYLKEALESQDIESIENPILKRCAEKNVDLEKGVHQAYDRMYHRHNRS